MQSFLSLQALGGYLATAGKQLWGYWGAPRTKLPRPKVLGGPLGGYLVAAEGAQGELLATAVSNPKLLGVVWGPLEGYRGSYCKGGCGGAWF